ncbi:MAG TPA: hypothetical protein VM840_06095 [Actinomycetota bacterium]|nr:hypothetical protein [Actinomycetota bacterium]
MAHDQERARTGSLVSRALTRISQDGVRNAVEALDEQERETEAVDEQLDRLDRGSTSPTPSSPPSR